MWWRTGCSAIRFVGTATASNHTTGCSQSDCASDRLIEISIEPADCANRVGLKKDNRVEKRRRAIHTHSPNESKSYKTNGKGLDTPVPNKKTVYGSSLVKLPTRPSNPVKSISRNRPSSAKRIWTNVSNWYNNYKTTKPISTGKMQTGTTALPM